MAVAPCSSSYLLYQEQRVAAKIFFHTEKIAKISVGQGQWD